MRLPRALLVAAATVALVVAAVLLAHGGWPAADTLTAYAERYGRGPAAPFIVALAFVVLGFLFVPVMLLIAVCGYAFGPLHGALYALIGAVASGVAGWVAGRFARDAVLARCSGLAEKLRARIARRGLLAVILIRLVPSGPFTLTNLIAGAIGIRFVHLLLGTALGLAPGIVVTVGLVELLAR